MTESENAIYKAMEKEFSAPVLIERLRASGLTLATAESCTGGNIAHTVTLVAGCSDVYYGGVVSYTNDVKQRVLGVSGETLAANGAVSEAVVCEMVTGAMRVTGATTAVATSGIAGPGGAVPGKPVGTVWIATATPEGIKAHCHHFDGNRDQVIEQASKAALKSLFERL